MADDEHEQTEESTAVDTETVVAEEEPGANPEHGATDDDTAEAVAPENVAGDEEKEEQAVLTEDVPHGDAETDEPGGISLDPVHGEVPLGDAGTAEGDEEEQEQAVLSEDVQPGSVDEPQPDAVEAALVVEPESGVPLDETGAAEGGKGKQEAVVSEDVPSETVDEPQPDAVEADESADVAPEPESGVPPEKAGATGDDVQKHDITDAEVVIPAVGDEEPVEPQDEAISPTDEGLAPVVDDSYEEHIVDDTEEEQLEVEESDEDLPQPAEQLPDEPCELMPYPSADEIDVADVIGEELAEVDELAELDEGDLPGPTRASDKVGPVAECPELPSPPQLLTEGDDDIEAPEDESKVPSVLVCFSDPFYTCLLY